MPPVIACQTSSYGRFGAQTAIEHVFDAGLEFVELTVRTPGATSRDDGERFLTTGATMSELRAVDQLLERNQVRVSSCVCLAGNPLDPRVIETVCRKLDIAAHFGVRIVMTGAGSAEDGPERDVLLRNLTAIGDYAAKLGITACFQTTRGVCVNHREMFRLMRELDHPHLRISFDTGNLLYYNDGAQVEVALARICGYVKHLHLKDSSGRFQERSYPALGSGGAVDFLRVYQLMRDCGFHGPYCIDIEGNEGEPDLSLNDRHQRVKVSVEFLRMLGYFE